MPLYGSVVRQVFHLPIILFGHINVGLTFSSEGASPIVVSASGILLLLTFVFLCYHIRTRNLSPYLPLKPKAYLEGKNLVSHRGQTTALLDRPVSC